MRRTVATLAVVAFSVIASSGLGAVTGADVSPEALLALPSATAPASWDDIVGVLASAGAMSSQEVADVALPALRAFSTSHPGKRWLALSRAVPAFGPNAHLLADDVAAKDLREVGRAVSSHVGLSAYVLDEVGRNPWKSASPGVTGMVAGLLDPEFPASLDPPACHFVDALTAHLPSWGRDEVLDGRLVRLIGPCPGPGPDFVLKGLRDGRRVPVSQAFAAMDDAKRRSGGAWTVTSEQADAMVDLAGKGLVPVWDRALSPRPPVETMARALVEAGRDDDALAAAGNAGRSDVYATLGRSVREARRPSSPRSLRDLLN